MQGLQVKDGEVRFALQVDPTQGAAMEPLRKAAETAGAGLDGVGKVLAVLTAHSEGEAPDPDARPAEAAEALPRFARVIRLDDNDETAYSRLADKGKWAI